MKKSPTEQDIKAWYDDRYIVEKEKNNRPFEAYPIFLDHLEAEKGKKLLDIACGSGFLLCAASLKGITTFGIDISPEAIKIAKEISPYSTLSVGKGEELEYSDRKFDYITCLGALEHFLDIDKGLQEMKRVAKDDATFCIMVPNSDFALWKLMGRIGTEQQDINENLMPLDQWRSIFKKNGFEEVHIYRDRWYEKFSSSSLSGAIKRNVGRFIWMFIPVKKAYQFIFILKKCR